MPAPTNISPASATDLGTLPASVSQDVHDSGTTYTVWYRYTATDDDTVIGLFGYGVASPGYRVETEVYDNIAVGFSDKLVDTGSGALNANRAVQFAVTSGTTYYIKFAPQTGNPTPAVLTIEAESFAQQTMAVGTIAVNDDTSGYPLALINPSTEAVERFVSPFPSGEAGDVLDDGTMAFYDESDGELTIYDNQFNVITQFFVNLSSLGGALRTCLGTQRWWICYIESALVKTRSVDPDGTLGTSHTLTSYTSVTAIAASNDETILYHTGPTLGSRAIERWDLVNDVALSDLAAEVAGYLTFDLLVLSDDSIVASYIDSTGTPDIQVRRYNAAGTLLNTYNFGANFVFPDGTQPRLAYAIDDPNSFWIWTHPSGASAGLSRFEEVDVATGAILNTVELREYERGVYNGTPTATPDARFGNSYSCPFLILRAEYPTSGTGTIRVVKVTIPESDATEFTFTAGGGLTPTSFALAHGEEQVFSSVAPGDGYSVEEDVNTAYQTTVSVSNGSSPTDITVADGETVVVTFTNSSIQAPGFNTRTRRRRWLRQSPVYSSESKRVRHKVFTLDCAVGQGTANEPGMDPQCYLQYSDDGGHTWSFVLPRSMGMRGKFSRLVQWWRLGVARNRVYRVYGSDPVFVALYDGFTEVEPGTD